MKVKSKTVLHYPFYFAAIIFLMISCNKKRLTNHMELISSARQLNYDAEQLKELEQTFGIVFSKNGADLTIHATNDIVNLKREAFEIESKNDVVEISDGNDVEFLPLAETLQWGSDNTV